MAAVESRKRFAIPYINEDHFCDPAKRCRYYTTPSALDGLRDIFPDASVHDLEACFAASGGDIHATAQAYRDQQAKQALASRLVQGGVDECAGVLVEQMAAATDLSDARNRATWVLGLIKNADAAEAARLREENALLKEQAARLREENAVLKEQAARLRGEAAAWRERVETAEQDNAVLKRSVLAVLQVHVNSTSRGCSVGHIM